MRPATAIQRGAVFGSARRYRYVLSRRWRPGGQTVLFVLLNPSTADARRDDPTIRRCIGFAMRWGFAALEVVNLFAYRATHPADLRRAKRPVGVRNDAHLRAAARRAHRIVVAWGMHGHLHGRDMAVCHLLLGEAGALSCLGTTQAGHPRHVLYLRGDSTLRPYLPPSARAEPTGGAVRRAGLRRPAAGRRTAARAERARRPAHR